MFDENFPSFYTKGVAVSNSCEFYTLPVFDGYLWSAEDEIAAMRFKAIIDGKEVLIEGADPEFLENSPGRLQITWPLTNIEGILMISLVEGSMTIEMESKNQVDWYLETNVTEEAKLPFRAIAENRIDCEFNGMNYFVEAEKGAFSEMGKEGFRINPDRNTLIINMSKRN